MPLGGCAATHSIAAKARIGRASVPPVGAARAVTARAVAAEAAARKVVARVVAARAEAACKVAGAEGLASRAVVARG